jgi:hypothetical protein
MRTPRLLQPLTETDTGRDARACTRVWPRLSESPWQDSERVGSPELLHIFVKLCLPCWQVAHTHARTHTHTHVQAWFVAHAHVSMRRVPERFAETFRSAAAVPCPPASVRSRTRSSCSARRTSDGCSCRLSPPFMFTTRAYLYHDSTTDASASLLVVTPISRGFTTVSQYMRTEQYMHPSIT